MKKKHDTKYETLTKIFLRSSSMSFLPNKDNGFVDASQHLTILRKQLIHDDYDLSDRLSDLIFSKGILAGHHAGRFSSIP